MEKLIFATNNEHKLEEIKKILKEKYKVLGLKEYGFEGDIPETGITLSENAFIKSDFIFKRFDIDVFSDDTGLEIDILNGEPGVYSARYAGEDGNSEANIKKVLEKMKGNKKRNARFKTVISLIVNSKEQQFEGKVEGQITTEKHGTSGFGYDPIFIPNGYSLTFAEMPLEEKNKISHRAKATAKLVDYLLKTSS